MSITVQLFSCAGNGKEQAWKVEEILLQIHVESEVFPTLKLLLSQLWKRT